jgi:MYXO-CTERM domain-containing protein
MFVPISGGVADAVDVAVVGIVDNGSGATCTGSLIAPNLVVTAQHCVVDAVSPGACTDATFGSPVKATRFFVTTEPTLTFDPDDYHAVSEIRIPPGGDAFCGRDIALLVLTDVVATTEAAPIDPRLDPALAVAELYGAVGFGATDDQGTGTGERRRRDGLAVDCVGDGCASTFIGTGEWRGETGICGGDSGGPALDAAGAVVGVASRGSVGCDAPVYTRIDFHATWLVDEAVRAAGIGGYDLPIWAGGTPAPDAGVPAADAEVPAADAGSAVDDPDAGGCGCSGSRDPGGLAVLALVALGVSRRRPVSSRPDAGTPRRRR